MEKKCTIFSGHPLLDFLKTHAYQLGVFLLWVAISLLLTTHRTQMRGSQIAALLKRGSRVKGKGQG